MVIELSGSAIWSEIIFVIKNRRSAQCEFDLKTQD